MTTTASAMTTDAQLTNEFNTAVAKEQQSIVERAKALKSTESRKIPQPQGISQEIPADLTVSEPPCQLRPSVTVLHHFVPAIATIRCTSEYFEEQNNGIVDFSRAMCDANEMVLGDSVLSRRGIECYFWMEVNRVYTRGNEFGDAKIEKLMGQLECPLMNRFWALRSTSAAAWTAYHCYDESKTGYYWGPTPSEEQVASDKGVVLLENEHGVVIVPKVGLLPLSEINYIQVWRDVDAANAVRTTPYEIRRIWKGILENLYADPDKTTKAIKLQDSYGTSNSVNQSSGKATTAQIPSRNRKHEAEDESEEVCEEQLLGRLQESGTAKAPEMAARKRRGARKTGN